MSKYKVYILLVLCNLFWAGNYVFGKYVVNELSPLMITFTRWTIASFILLGISYFTEKPKIDEIIKIWPYLISMGLLGVIGYNMILYSALDYTSSLNAALVNALNPGVIVIFSGLLLRERVSKIQTAGIMVSLLGVLIILTKGNMGQIFKLSYNVGDLLMLGAILVWTFYSIIGRRVANVKPITVTAVSALIAAVIMLPFAIIEGIDYIHISSLAITGIIYITIFPSVLSYVLWNVSIREIGASKAGIFMNLIPVFTAIISWLLGNEITIAQIMGGLLVFIGVYATTGMMEKRIGSITKKSSIS